MPTGHESLPGEVTYLDVAPLLECLGQPLVRLGVGGFEVVEGLLGEDHTEPIGVAGTVSLQNRDLIVGPCLLHQDGEVEAGRATTDASDAHAREVSYQPLRSRP
jgi:hypothetical protein